MKRYKSYTIVSVDIILDDVKSLSSQISVFDIFPLEKSMRRREVSGKPA
jgi:hypothetical protein